MTDSRVAAPPDAGSDSPGVYGWDWSATTHQGREHVVNDLCDAMGAEFLIPGKGLQGWPHSIEGYDAEGFKVGQVYYGGGREDVHVVSTSGRADAARRSVLAFDADARTSRVDTRVDTLVKWDDLVDVCEAAASTYGSTVTMMESRKRGVSQGRTLYIGAPSSAVRVRLYEKWLESPGQYVEGTNRVEVQLRPASNVKGRVSGWAPAATFCASKTTKHLAAALGTELVPEATLHVAKGTPDLERTLQVMGEQYGNAVEKWLALSGGDVDTVVDRLVGRASRRLAAEGGRLGIDRPSVRQDGWVAAEGLL